MFRRVHRWGDICNTCQKGLRRRLVQFKLSEILAKLRRDLAVILVYFSCYNACFIFTSI